MTIITIYGTIKIRRENLSVLAKTTMKVFIREVTDGLITSVGDPVTVSMCIKSSRCTCPMSYTFICQLYLGEAGKVIKQTNKFK